MVKNLTKHGNSYALIIDKPIMELLGIEPESPLEVTTDGKALTVRPIGGKSREERLSEAVSKTNRKYAKALKRLAE